MSRFGLGASNSRVDLANVARGLWEGIEAVAAIGLDLLSVHSVPTGIVQQPLE
jgi:hypothetical protein